MSDERPEVFLQWKGTDACLDFYCTCGQQWHFDGFFARDLTCGHCGQAWQLPHLLTPQAIEPTDPLTLCFDVPVISPERNAEFRIRWPRKQRPDMRPGAIVTVVDDDNGCHRAVYADLLKVESGGQDDCWLTLRTRDPV